MKSTPARTLSHAFLLFFATFLISACVGGSGGSGLAPIGGESDTVVSPEQKICANAGAATAVCEENTNSTTTAEPCPFVGHTNSKGLGFTCTTCPSGYDWLDGTWMFFQNEPGDAPFVDVIEFEANRFTETIIGEDQPGEPVTTAVLKGYYFCPSKSEYTSLRKIFVIESVEPTDGLFGNHAGDSYPCDILQDTSGVSVLLWCDYEWSGDPPLSSQFEFCREGKAVDGKPCDLPPL